jgi:hypothetical protein
MDNPVITLLTDFGLKDGYVASMKGVILSICPEAVLVDVSHEIDPADIRSGAYVLATAYGCFPRGAIHVAVVDPGVGTSRKAVGIKVRDATLIGPDNGLFSWVLRSAPGYEAWSLENREYRLEHVSCTFHGRDIFAPAAAHVAHGVPLKAFGPPCTPLIEDWTTPKREAGRLRGEVIHIDRFGNAVTNIGMTDLERLSPLLDRLKVVAASHCIHPISRAYGDSPPDTLITLIGSSGHLEIAVSMGNGAERLGLKTGDPIDVGP